MWTNGKRTHPKQTDCERYCEQYPCDKTVCMRRKMIINGQIKMKPKYLCDYYDNNMRRRLYEENRATLTN